MNGGLLRVEDCIFEVIPYYKGYSAFWKKFNNSEIFVIRPTAIEALEAIYNLANSILNNIADAHNINENMKKIVK